MRSDAEDELVRDVRELSHTVAGNLRKILRPGMLVR